MSRQKQRHEERGGMAVVVDPHRKQQVHAQPWCGCCWERWPCTPKKDEALRNLIAASTPAAEFLEPTGSLRRNLDAALKLAREVVE